MILRDLKCFNFYKLNIGFFVYNFLMSCYFCFEISCCFCVILKDYNFKFVRLGVILGYVGINSI